jgi:hypothetical protein
MLWYELSGSDETPEACKFITCRKDEFRCRYGEIDWLKKLNPKNDLHD